MIDVFKVVVDFVAKVDAESMVLAIAHVFEHEDISSTGMDEKARH